MIKAVIFDLDDTLYDELDYCKSGFAAVANFLHEKTPEISTEALFNELWKAFQHGDRSRTFNTALESLGLSFDDELIRKLVVVYREHPPTLSLPADTKETLDKLKASYKLCLLTDGFLPAQRLKVEALGIEQYFSRIIYTEQLGRQCWKPSTAGFEKLLDELAVPENQVVYVADNPAKDFIAPNRLGIISIQILRPNRIHTDKAPRQAAEAQHSTENIRQLPQLLEKL